MMRRSLMVTILTLAFGTSVADEPGHPRLLFSNAELAEIKATPELPSAFAEAVASARLSTDEFLTSLPDIPEPRDAGGGYTHEQHKRNATTILNAGVLYRLTGEAAYAELARDMLLAYAAFYADLPEHPQRKEQSPGKLFWQSLNEAVWLVTSIQGYDAIYASLDADTRATIEDGLLRPMVRFLSIDAPQTFDKIHNHGTWAVAAVGMTGYVLGDEEYVEKALYGLNKDGSAGFMKQLDELFSPDGYYSEGPYYQRYALMPFMLFANAIERNEPERNIFQHRDGILLKAVYTTVQLSYAGYFFPINDALKDKGLDTIELVYGLSIAYAQNRDNRLLSVAQMQDRVALTGDGFHLAQALDAGLAEPFDFASMQLRDGTDGSEGALSILRSGDQADQQALVIKSTAQGMGHGHFDKLGWLFYDNGNAIITDYGAARFLNVEEKNGGHYLAENTTWAKQTVAHNTLVVDETSHFDGDWKTGQQYHPVPLVFELNDDIQIAGARMDDAYDDVSFLRVMALMGNELAAGSRVLDVVKAKGTADHQYDLPLYFQGHITNINHPVQSNDGQWLPLGDDNGYQHLWVKARTEIPEGELLQLTWLTDNRFYTYSVVADAPMEVYFTQIGANDPNFNLRNESGLLLRTKGATGATFVSVLESHGEYNGSREFTTASSSSITGLRRTAGEDADLIQILSTEDATWTIGLSYNPDTDKSHSIDSGGVRYEWSGFYRLFDE